MKLEIVFKDGRKATFDDVVSFNVTEEAKTDEKIAILKKDFEMANTPTEGKLFEVNPLEIDRSKFEKVFTDTQMENTRQTIQEAFEEVDKSPEKYAHPFYTLIPEHKPCRVLAETIDYAKELGGYMADWVEQAMEWAQRICNGESWKKMCKDADNANYIRIVKWKDGRVRLVGGDTGRAPTDVDTGRCYYAPTDVDMEDGFDEEEIYYCGINEVVPLVVFK